MGDVVRFNYQQWRLADDWVTNHGVENIVYSSVANVPPQEWIDKWKEEGRTVVTLQPGRPLPFPSRYRTPATLGQDRIAAIVGAIHDTASPTYLAPAASQYSDTSAPVRPSRLIVDAGTCLTTDVVDSTGLHLGGNISPGIEMRLRAMHEYTARLPLVNAGELAFGLGDSTEAALRQGGSFGVVAELEGFYHRLADMHPRLDLLLTGGDAPWLADRLSIPCTYRPHLVLRGLIKILSLYAHNES